MMDDPDEAKPRPIPPDLERLSIEELEARIKELEAQIAICRGLIARKRSHLGAAAQFFRS